MLTTARLVLRPLAAGDAPALLAMSREPLARRWLPDQVFDDEAAAAARAELLATLAAERRPAVTPLVLGVEASGRLVGHVGLSPCRGSVEIGYGIAEALHGQGLATEAVAAVASWALAELHLPEVLGVVGADNRASRRVLEKAGFALAADEGARLVYRTSA